MKIYNTFYIISYDTESNPKCSTLLNGFVIVKCVLLQLFQNIFDLTNQFHWENKAHGTLLGYFFLVFFFLKKLGSNVSDSVSNFQAEFLLL